ncbi:hypothetical protein K435DRAFT_696584, partial [Dendrothele bispora CBS 962.96]
LVDELKAWKEKGKQSQSGWAGVVWTGCEDRMRKDFPDKSKSGKQCKEHWNSTLKKNFKVVHSLVTKGSGWGWDPIKKHVTATDSVWDDYLEAHPTHSRWHTTSFLLYDDIFEWCHRYW